MWHNLFIRLFIYLWENVAEVKFSPFVGHKTIDIELISEVYINNVFHSFPAKIWTCGDHSTVKLKSCTVYAHHLPWLPPCNSGVAYKSSSSFTQVYSSLLSWWLWYICYQAASWQVWDPTLIRGQSYQALKGRISLPLQLQFWIFFFIISHKPPNSLGG